MQRKIKLGLIALSAVSLALTRLTTGRPADALASESASPRSLYVQNCARCHGSDGRANTPMGRKLEAPDLTSADVQGKSAASIARAIKNGRPGMPVFGKKLRAAQISSIAGYVRSL